MEIMDGEIKKSFALQAVFPMNCATVVLLILKLTGVLDITWLVALIPAMSLAMLLGLMAEFGLHMRNKELREKQGQ